MADSCYSFWIGGTLKILENFDETDLDSTRIFLIDKCQSIKYGGFSKIPDNYPDILHSFYSICWLSLSNSIQINEDNYKNIITYELNNIDPSLVITKLS